MNFIADIHCVETEKSAVTQTSYKMVSLWEAGSLTVPVVAVGAIRLAEVHASAAEGKVVALVVGGNGAGDIMADSPSAQIHRQHSCIGW